MDALKISISSVRYGRHLIPFTLSYNSRKTMEIAVNPDGTVAVKAPRHIDIPEIERRIIKRGRWIIKQINFFEQFTPRTPARAYLSGETHRYLGRQYRLKIGQGKKNEVKLLRGYIQITSRHEPTPPTIKRLLDQWYLKKARQHFAANLERRLPSFAEYGIERPLLAIRTMRKRWGSLSPAGRMTLNRDLIRASKEAIDYVVTHEICHLIHSNHNPAFYALLSTLLPTWQAIKQRLELQTS